MRIFRKPIILASAGVSLCGLLSQSALAQSTIESGTSILAPATPPVGGITAAPYEYLTVSWSVVLTGTIYTYNYTVNNPNGDVLLNPVTDQLTSTSEVVDAFQVTVDTTVPGALVGGPSGGVYQMNNGADGLFWLLNSVPAGSSSPVLSFESLLPPTTGTANAQDSDPPSPWSSTSPNGQLVPVPNTAFAIPEPGTIGLLCLGGALLAPFRSVFRRKK